jgi:hypothetical protein
MPHSFSDRGSKREETVMYRFGRVAWGLALVAVVVTLAAAPAAATAGSGSGVDALLAATDHGRPSRDAIA